MKKADRVHGSAPEVVREELSPRRLWTQVSVVPDGAHVVEHELARDRVRVYHTTRRAEKGEHRRRAVQEGRRVPVPVVELERAAHIAQTAQADHSEQSPSWPSRIGTPSIALGGRCFSVCAPTTCHELAITAACCQLIHYLELTVRGTSILKPSKITQIRLWMHENNRGIWII